MKNLRLLCILTVLVLLFGILPSTYKVDASFSNNEGEGYENDGIDYFPFLKILEFKPGNINSQTGERYAVAGTLFTTTIKIKNEGAKPFDGIVIIFLKVRDTRGYYLDRIQYSGPVSSEKVVIDSGDTISLNLTCDVPIQIRLPLQGKLGVGFLSKMDYIMPGLFIPSFREKYYGPRLFTMQPPVFIAGELFKIMALNANPFIRSLLWSHPLFAILINVVSPCIYLTAASVAFKQGELPVHKILFSQIGSGSYEWTETEKFRKHFGNWINFSVYIKQTEPAQIGVGEVRVYGYPDGNEDTSLNSGEKIVVNFTIFNKGAKETEVNIFVDLLEPSAVGTDALRAKINLNMLEGMKIDPFDNKSSELICVVPDNIESGFYDLQVSCTTPYVYGLDLPTLNTRRVRVSIKGSMNPQIEALSSDIMKTIPIIFFLALISGAIFIIMYYKFGEYFRKK